MSIRNLNLLMVILLCQGEIGNSLKILGVFPMAIRSHSMMSETLMKELAWRGHEVTVLSPYSLKHKVPNYTDITMEITERPVDVNSLAYSDVLVFRTISMRYFTKIAGTDICDLLSERHIQEVLNTRRGYYDVIVIEMFMFPCYLAFGQHLNAPIVGMVTTKLHDWLPDFFGSPLNPAYVPSLLAHFTQRMTFWERLQNTIITDLIKYQMNYYLNKQVKYVEKYFGRKLSSIQELYEDVSLILVNSHHSIDDIKPLTPDIIEVGGLHVFDDQELTPDLQEWLDNSSDGCVYFTLGSMVKIETYPVAIIRVLYETFERIAPIRVLMKVANASALPPGLPLNVKTSPWFPQVAVLSHNNVKLFMTHGGLMGTQEAIAHRVPMIGFPLFGDQYINIQNYVNKKIAISLNLDEALTADALTNAINTILTDNSYRNNIERLSNLFLDRPLGAPDTAAYWVEYAAINGKVLKSPATDLTWWQFYLLDVYGFIIICIFAVLYCMKKFVAFLLRVVRSRMAKGYFKNTSKSKKID